MTATRKMRRRALQRTKGKGWKGATAEIAIHAVSEPGGLWIHTHGLRERDLPELEIRDAPTWLMRPGAKLLNTLADYLASPEKPVQPGDVIDVADFGILQLVRAEPQDPILDHYDHERWAVVSVPDECDCPFCRAREAGRSLQ